MCAFYLLKFMKINLNLLFKIDTIMQIHVQVIDEEDWQIYFLAFIDLIKLFYLFELIFLRHHMVSAIFSN